MSGQSAARVMAERWQGAERPIVIGIGGGSGAGKSTVAEILRAGLNPLLTTVITQDQFFKNPEEMPTYYSGFHQQQRPDFNHPDSTDTDAMVAFCQSVDEADVVILEGILVLHYREARSVMHLMCYVDTDIGQMLARRTDRNLAAGYGGSAQEIAHYNADCVGPQHRRFNTPTAQHADILIPNSDGRSEDRDRAIAGICGEVEEIIGR